jgi:hypothetical protein
MLAAFLCQLGSEGDATFLWAVRHKHDQDGMDIDPAEEQGFEYTKIHK